jgi:hypothetical protein
MASVLEKGDKAGMQDVDSGKESQTLGGGTMAQV